MHPLCDTWASCTTCTTVNMRNTWSERHYKRLIWIEKGYIYRSTCRQINCNEQVISSIRYLGVLYENSFHLFGMNIKKTKMLTNSWVEPAGCFFSVVDVVDITLRSNALLPAMRQWAEAVWWRWHHYSWCALVTILKQHATARLFVWTSRNTGRATFTMTISNLLLLRPHALGSTAITTSRCQQPLI